MAERKFHISSNGEVVTCPAKIRCRLAPPEEHFTSREEAQKFADKKNEEIQNKERIETLKKENFQNIADTIYNIGTDDAQYFKQDNDIQESLKLWKEIQDKYERNQFHNAVIEGVRNQYISLDSNFFNEWYEDRLHYNDYPVDFRILTNRIENINYINPDLKEEYRNNSQKETPKSSPVKIKVRKDGSLRKNYIKKLLEDKNTTLIIGQELTDDYSLDASRNFGKDKIVSEREKQVMLYNLTNNGFNYTVIKNPEDDNYTLSFYEDYYILKNPNIEIVK